MSKMPKIVELRQDRNLINSHFDGYKLSLDPVPILRQQLPCGVLRGEANVEQYSLLHAELFSMHNYLVVDPWIRYSAYFVNQQGEVVRCAYDENSGRPESLQTVYRLGENERRTKGDYNYSLRFVSEKYSVLCNGINQLFLLDTGDRQKATEWKAIATTQITAVVTDQDVGRNFVIFDCRLDIIQEQKQISLALGQVLRMENAKAGLNHFMNLHWAKWVYEENWIFSILDTIEGNGSLYYCAFEPRAESLIISSNRQYQFVSQKHETPAEETIKCEDVQIPWSNTETTEQMPDFTWSQTEEDVIVVIPVESFEIEKTDYHIDRSSDQLIVKLKEGFLLNHALFAEVDQTMTTWTIEKDILQIILAKKDPTLCWPSIFIDGAGPKECLDNDIPNCLSTDQQPIPNLEAPIEECDFPMQTMNDDVTIKRFHLPTKSVTHAVHLGSTPPLFASSLRPGYPLAIATRQDVDASLWLQQYNPSKPQEWSLRHEGNINAFGYVQASKQQKKFMDCSPDLSYAIICESHRHIFVYKSKYDSANGLRKRSGPQVSLGKQQLVSLEQMGEVLGIATAPNVTILLTENNYLLYLQLN